MRLVLLVPLFVSLASAQDWPRFRGSNGSGVSRSTGLPVEFGPSKNVLWKASVPFGRSSPIIVGDRIFITASEEKKLIVMCLDRVSGKVLWRRAVDPLHPTPIHKTNDVASPTPVSDGKNVYAFFGTLGLISFGPDGNERWRLPLGPFDTFYGIGSSPILHDGTLVMLCDQRSKAFLVAVDAATGRIRWRVERTTASLESYASPIVHQTQVIVLGAKRIDAYSLASGEKQWWVTGLGAFPVGSPVISGNVAIFSTYGSDETGPGFDAFLKNDTNKDGRLTKAEMPDFEEFGAMDLNSDGFMDRAELEHMIKAGSGDYGLIAVQLGAKGDITKTGVVWRSKKNYPTLSTPIVYDGVFFMVKSGGIIGSYNPATGDVFKLGRTKDAIEEHYASPVAADGKLYFVSEHGKLTVIKADKQWEILAVNDLAEDCQSTPAIAGRSIYVRTKSALYAFGAK